MARDAYVHAPSALATASRQPRGRRARRMGVDHSPAPRAPAPSQPTGSGWTGGPPREDDVRLMPAAPDLLDDLDQRGLIHDTTDRAALAARLAQGPITLYYGCDPTAPSLHHGNLIGLIMLRRFQDAGHRPIALAGGATGHDRRSRRPLRGAQPPRRRDAGRQRRRHQGADQPDPRPRGALDAGRQPHVDRRRAAARLPPRRRQARHREPDGGPGEREGPHGQRARDLLHGVQLHAPPGQRLRPPARARGLRAADRRLRPVGQHPLRRRPDPPAAGRRPSTPCAGRCSPPTTARRSARPPAPGCGSIPELTSPYAFFQHWINVDDAEVERMLAMFTLLPMDEIDAARGGARGDPGRRVAQRALAREVTDLVHGADGARRPPRRPARSSSGPTPGRRPRPPWPPWPGRSRWPRSTGGEDLGAGVPLGPVLQRAGLASSQGDARRQLEQGGVSVNGEKAAPDAPARGRRRPPRSLGAAAQGEEGLGAASICAQEVDTSPGRR